MLRVYFYLLFWYNWNCYKTQNLLELILRNTKPRKIMADLNNQTFIFLGLKSWSSIPIFDMDLGFGTWENTLNLLIFVMYGNWNCEFERRKLSYCINNYLLVRTYIYSKRCAEEVWSCTFPTGKLLTDRKLTPSFIFSLTNQTLTKQNPDTLSVFFLLPLSLTYVRRLLELVFWPFPHVWNQIRTTL